jgi:hypothetical protein
VRNRWLIGQGSEKNEAIGVTPDSMEKKSSFGIGAVRDGRRHRYRPRVMRGNEASSPRPQSVGGRPRRLSNETEKARKRHRRIRHSIGGVADMPRRLCRASRHTVGADRNLVHLYAGRARHLATLSQGGAAQP